MAEASVSGRRRSRRMGDAPSVAICVHLGEFFVNLGEFFMNQRTCSSVSGASTAPSRSRRSSRHVDSSSVKKAAAKSWRVDR